jgi:hypothetical protein
MPAPIVQFHYWHVALMEKIKQNSPQEVWQQPPASDETLFLILCDEKLPLSRRVNYNRFSSSKVPQNSLEKRFISLY